MQTAFQAQQYAISYPDGVQRHYWHLARNRLINRVLRMHGASPSALTLDIGCGRGIAVDFLCEHGWNAIGCDTGRPAPITPSVGSRLHVETDAFVLDESVRQKVETLLLLDVLEHLEDPAGFLNRCRTAFPRCTLLLVTVPARPELWSNYDEFYGHHCRYTPTTLSGLAGTDMALLSLGYFFHLLYVPALLLRLLQMKREVSMPAPKLPLLHRCLAAFFGAEQCLLPACVPGSSLYAVFRPTR
ncbi:MAG TPA: methyltransferase domain-containing protein [Planctomycetota bacterium]